MGYFVLSRNMHAQLKNIGNFHSLSTVNSRLQWQAPKEKSSQGINIRPLIIFACKSRMFVLKIVKSREYRLVYRTLKITHMTWVLLGMTLFRWGNKS
jgi:hypothetical protein